MIQRAFFSAIAAIFLSAMLVQVAAAYPSTARSGTSTVTGTYRPLDLDLTLINGTDALDFTSGTVSTLSFQADFSGNFVGLGVGYSASGPAGTWRLLLSEGFDSGVTVSASGNTITMSSSSAVLQVGTLTYLGGLSATTGSLQPDDTPQLNDFFNIYSTVNGPVLDVVCQDGTSLCNIFDLTLIQDLAHIGPFNILGTTGQIGLDGSRLNTSCETANDPNPCGTLIVSASSVPEPATLALLGLGLAGLSLSRRARA